MNDEANGVALTPDQQNIIKLLEVTLKEAQKGTFNTMAIVGVTEQGFGPQVVGGNIPAVYMGLSVAMRQLEQAVTAPPQQSRILRPGR